MLTADQFAQIFPEFQDAARFPPSQVNFWLTTAYSSLSNRFGAQLDLAAALFTAHNLVLGESNTKTSNSGGAPGTVTGPVSSQSAGPVSQSYDIESMVTQGAGVWNATTYGMRFWSLLKAAKIGGLYVPAREIGGGIV